MAIDVSKYSERRKRVSDLAENIVQAYEDFDYYRETSYTCIARPAIFWPDGKSLGYGWASHLAGSAQKFCEKFRYWGFSSVEDFYCLPIEKRNEFLKNAKSIWEETFWEDDFQQETAQDVLNIWRLDNARMEQLLSSLTNAEQEFHNKLVGEARRIKNECYNSRRLRRRIRNEKARFKGEDKLRERTRYSFGGSGFIDEIWLQSFRLQEKVKRLIGLRERFPNKAK